MCIIDISDEEGKKILDDLPEEFPCWKAMSDKNGRTEYDLNDVEKKLRRGSTYKAEFNQAFRIHAPYAPAFHAFLCRENAESYRFTHHVVTKFHARKADIKKIGYSKHTRFICIAVSRITRK